MKTFYLIINYVERLVSALVSNMRSEELHMKPVRVKVDERPGNPRTRGTE